MDTALFLDVENMGSRACRRAVDKMVKRFGVTKKELVYSTAANLPASFRNMTDWLVHRCKPGKDAADKILQKHILKAANDKNVDKIIVVTSDHGFLDVCRRVLDAGKFLLLMVQNYGLLAKSILSRAVRTGHLRVFEVEKLREIGTSSSIFIRRRETGELVEVPFLSGILLGDFVVVLKENGLYRRKLSRWIHENYLEIRDGRVFIMSEERIAAA